MSYLQSNHRCKITDLGEAHLITQTCTVEKAKTKYLECGTVAFMAPKIMIEECTKNNYCRTCTARLALVLHLCQTSATRVALVSHVYHSRRSRVVRVWHSCRKIDEIDK